MLPKTYQKEDEKSSHSNILFLRIIKEKEVLLSCENLYNYM